MKLLFSTTRQWNPGDEFILHGIRRLLDAVSLDYTAIIYNRHPEVNPNRPTINPFRKSKGITSFRGKNFIDAFFRSTFWDNSYKYFFDGRWVDAIIFSGTPEWYNERSRPLYDLARRHALPIYFIGIGLGEQTPVLPKMVQDALAGSPLIIVRDEETRNLLHDYDVHYLPCPAFLSAPRQRLVKEVNTIGLIYTTNETVPNQRLRSETAYNNLLNIYGTLIKRHGGKRKIIFIAHYIDELERFESQYGDSHSVLYSYDARDYIHLYNKCDFVIGPRVHGIGIAASLGIPGFALGHDLREQTVEGFQCSIASISKGADIGRIADKIDSSISDCSAQSQRLIKHKEETWKHYLALLKDTPLIGNAKSV